ncbi:hypothetical protein Tco_0355443 [Tanacetum coccineum]
MSRTNSQAKLSPEEELFHVALTDLYSKKNHHRVCFNSHITGYNAETLSLNSKTHTLRQPFPYLQPYRSSTYTNPKTKMIVVSKMVITRFHQPWRAIRNVLNRSLTGKDSSWDTVRLPILQILWGIVHSANLVFTSLI